MSEQAATQADEQPVKIQHYIDSKTGERMQLKVKSIKHRFQQGKGGAISGAEPAKPKPAIKALNTPEQPAPEGKTKQS